MRGNLGLIFSSGKASTLFLIEVVGLGVLPMLLLFSPGVRKSVDGILWSQVLVIAGVLMNRFNVSFLSQSNGPGSYFPALSEFALSVGLVALAVFLYRGGGRLPPDHDPRGGPLRQIRPGHSGGPDAPWRRCGTVACAAGTARLRARFPALPGRPGRS